MAFQSDAFQNDTFQMDSRFGMGQATALIDSSIKQQWGQAQALIHAFKGFGQAQCYVRPRVGLGQAQCYILVHNNEYENVAFSHNPLAYFRLNETTGTNYVNVIGTGDGTGSANVTQSVAHVLDNASANLAVTFNSGTLSQINAAITGIPTATGSAVTVTGWVKLVVGGTAQMFWGWFVYDMYYNGSTILGFNTGNGDFTSFDPTGLISNWVHIAAVYYDNQTPATANKIYLNGVNKTLSVSGSPLARDLDVNFYLSGWGASGGEWAHGTSMDEVGVYDRELTAAEILDQFNAGMPRGYGQAQATITATGFQPGQATALIDSSIKQQMGQAQAFLVPTRIFGQAQAKLNAFGVNGCGQAQCIVNQFRRTAQAQAKILLPANEYDNVVLSQLPKGFWPLDESSGDTFVNLIGSGDGTRTTGTITYSVDHPLANATTNKGITFGAGAAAKIDATMTGIPTATGSAVTVTGYIKLHATNEQMFWGFFVYELYSISNRLGFNTGVTDSYGFDSTSIMGIWVHVAAVYYDQVDPNTVGKIYINGVSQTLNAQNDSIARDLDSPFHLSGWGVDNSIWAKGTGMDQVALFNRELTAGEILDQYNAGLPRGYGQAQAKIVPQAISQLGQAQADIKQTNNGFGQAQADILQPGYGSGQTQCDIKAIYWGLGQAQCDVKAVSYGLGQAQADIKAVISSCGQAQCDIKTQGYGFGQAQCDIKTQGWGSGQANCYIQTQGYGSGQAQCRVVGENAYAQAQADIKQIYYQPAQAQARITAIIPRCAQAQCYIYIAQIARPIADLSNDGWIRTVI